MTRKTALILFIVKLWSITSPKPEMTIEGRSNVCCVQFHPQNKNLFAFGAADHSINLYDARMSKIPMYFLHGHRKAVSYIKFLSDTEIMSASTDSSLRLWKISTELDQDDAHPAFDPPGISYSDFSFGHPLHFRQTKLVSESRKFTGHVNERNFVGLTALPLYTTTRLNSFYSPWIACGSENNAIYLYYKNISKPVLQYHLSPIPGFSENLPDRGNPNMFPWYLSHTRNQDDFLSFFSSRLPSNLLQNLQLRMQSTVSADSSPRMPNPRSQLQQLLFNTDSAALAVNPQYHSLASMTSFVASDPPTAGPHFISAIAHGCKQPRVA
jgi:WD40 repeat protein